MESKDFDYRKLNAILDKEGITAEQLAKMTGKTKKAVQPWLNGTATPHKSSLSKIIEVLHISEDRISKDFRTMQTLTDDKINEAWDVFLDVIMPYFAYYEASSVGYEAQKKLNLLNNMDGYKGKTIHLMSLDKQKTSLDNNLEADIDFMRKFVSRDDFPMVRMKNYSKGILKQVARDFIRKEYQDFEDYELYRGVCSNLIQKIEERIKNTPKLQEYLLEKQELAVLDFTKYKEIKRSFEVILSQSIVIFNLFEVCPELVRDFIHVEYQNYPNFLLFYYLSFNDIEFSDQFTDYLETHSQTVSSKEVPVTEYLKGRIKEAPDDLIKKEYARRILIDLKTFTEKDEVQKWIDERYPKSSILTSSTIMEFYRKLSVLVDFEIRQYCVEILSEDSRFLNLKLATILEELPDALKAKKS